MHKKQNSIAYIDCTHLLATQPYKPLQMEGR